MRRRQSISYVDREKVVTLDIDQEIKATAERPAGKVLLLEDRDDFREILQQHLAFRFYKVISVRNGIEGLRKIMKGRFDLIICDMMMPQMGGEMFYWAVTRARPGTARRFIFFTGHRNTPAIQFFFRRVNATVLIKPFRLAELDSAMHNVLLKLR